MTSLAHVTGALDWRRRLGLDLEGGAVRMPIASKLILSFLAVIVLISAVFMVVGVRLIGNRVVAEAQAKVRNDLNAAREINASKLQNVNDVVRFTADRYLLRNALIAGSIWRAREELIAVQQREGLDVLSVTDASGTVLLRASNRSVTGDSQLHDALVDAVLVHRQPVAATAIVSGADLERESPALAHQARLGFIDTPRARPRSETEETAGMMLKAAAPILDYQGKLIGTLYGGVLQNRDYEIVDKIKATVYQDVKYEGQDIGTATIFQDDVRISTNVHNVDGSRAIGTRVTEEVYDRVVGEGMPWIGRAYVVNNWYITAYEPIRDLNEKIVGILYVGILEQKYSDIQSATILAFLAITLLGAITALTLGYALSRRISGPIHELVTASSEVAQGNLDAKVEITTDDELQELADTFNTMAAALKARDEQVQEMARRRVRKSERLAMVGQLAAGVAHELNNPMQGIVAYSLMLLEELPPDDPMRDSIDTIVNQANRCTRIVRGLLDFSRQKKPHKKAFDVRTVLDESIALLEGQALFHNITVERRYEDSLPLAVVDPSQIQQVFMNLIMNAAEAMEGTGLLALTARTGPAGECVEVLVSDTGSGIRAEDMDRLFVPFFTTKEEVHGVGLGLAISYGIVREHKGTIAVDSEPGEGTTFAVILPIDSNGATDENDQ